MIINKRIRVETIIRNDERTNSPSPISNSNVIALFLKRAIKAVASDGKSVSTTVPTHHFSGARGFLLGTLVFTALLGVCEPVIMGEV